MRPTLAAVTLDASGGGVAAVSRLMWRAMAEQWPESRLIQLLPAETATVYPSTARRVQFGVSLLRRSIGRSEPVLFSHLGLSRALRPTPRPLRPPYGLFLHGIEAWQTFTGPSRTLLDRASVIVANSKFTAARFAAMNTGLQPVETCALALAPEDVEVAAKAVESDRCESPPTAVVIGRLSASERYKGHDELLDAWPAVRRVVTDARLVIAGEGDDLSRLRGKAADLGVGDSVTFPGFVSDTERAHLYRTARVFAMPSRGEGFGLVYLEAMAHGLPCIGSTHDAATEVIEDGATGFLVDQSNAPQLVDRLIRLLTNESERLAFGAAARKRLQDHFSYERFRTQIVGITQRVGRARKAGRSGPRA